MMFEVRASLIGQASRKGVPMSDKPVQRTNHGAITCDPRPQLPDGFRRNSTRVGRRSARPAPGSASTSCRRARRSALITTKILTRNGSWSSQARRPCGIRAARTSSNPGTSSSFRPVPPEHISCGTPAGRPPASRCSPRTQRRSGPSSTRTATWSGSGQTTKRSTSSSNEAAPRTTRRRGLLRRARPRGNRSPGQCSGISPDAT